MTKVLDHGYVSFVESWGSDERIIEAARMSTGKGFLGWGPRCERCGSDEEQMARGMGQSLCGSKDGHVVKPGDEKLLRYLWENKHATPFEMAGMVIEVQAPIFVFREWHRHRTQSYNEMSARYTPLPDVNYVPTIARMLVNAGGSNKQAGTVAGSRELTNEAAGAHTQRIQQQYADAEKLYQDMLYDGMPKELARIVLPVGRYSRMRASANLRNWLAFLTLRTDPAAQYEIREFANAVGSLIQITFPRTWELFTERR